MSKKKKLRTNKKQERMLRKRQHRWRQSGVVRVRFVRFEATQKSFETADLGVFVDKQKIPKNDNV